MWWPFRKRRAVEPSPEALGAQRQAAEGLRQELDRSAEVARVVDSIRKAQVKNHFSEAMEHLMVVRSKPGESR
jgi:hypothetical protein